MCYLKSFQINTNFDMETLTNIFLLLRRGVSPYEHMDSWEKFDETAFPNKKAFYSEFYLEDITDNYYIHAQKIFKELEIKNLDQYHDLYVQSDTLFLADVFENFKNKCTKYISLILLIFYLHLGYHGKLV